MLVVMFQNLVRSHTKGLRAMIIARAKARNADVEVLWNSTKNFYNTYIGLLL